MRKLFSKILASCTVAVCMFLCSTAAQAAETTIQVADPHYDVYAAGTKVVFPTEAGDTFLSPITYAYSTYIPVRNAGEWMGKTVSWDQATQTVSLTGTGTPVFHSEEEKRAGTTSVEVNGEAQLCPDISVVVDGVKQTFKNEKGAVVHPKAT